MNKILSFCFLAAGLCFAQNPFEVPLQQAPSEGAVPVEEAPVAPAEEPVLPPPLPSVAVPPPPPPALVPEQKAPEQPAKSVFDAVRGHAYNPFSTVGAANNVLDLISNPSDINGQKFVYISPDLLGYVAFDAIGGSMLFGLDNSTDDYVGALILGYANSAFGVALSYSVAKEWRSNETISSRHTYAGDNISLYFSLPGGAYANASWLTYDFSSARSYDDVDEKQDYSEIDANVGLLGSAGSLSYDTYLNVFRTGGSFTHSDSGKAVELNAYLGAALCFDFGYTALQNETARVIIGSNNGVGALFFDKIRDGKSDKIIIAIIQPNILSEVILSDKWLAFAGASQALSFEFGDGDRDEDTSYIRIMQHSTQALFAGMRYQRKNLALEAQVLDSNPFAAFDGRNILTQLGGFVYF